MATNANISPADQIQIAGGQTPFIADGVQTVVTITHNAGFVPSYYSLTTSLPITTAHLTREIDFPDVNTMTITFGSAPIVGEDANYIWVLFE